MMLWMLAACAGLTVNDVTTGESDAYPELKSLWAQTNPGRAFDRAEIVARSMPGWKNCEVSRPDRRPVLHCEAHTRFFVDDVWIWTVSAGGGMARVMTRSASRVGKGDLGTNHRRILMFQDAYQHYEQSGR